MTDTLRGDGDDIIRFLFERFPVRGEHVALDDSWRQVLERAEYPNPVRNLLGEAMAAVSLLSGGIKFDGSVTIQVQGDGPVHLLVARCSSRGEVRGLARWKSGVPEADQPGALLGEGRMAITLEPEGPGRRYQGIVPLEGGSLSAAFEGYFRQSEQMETRLWLGADENRACGLLLQQLPGAMDTEEFREHWRRVGMLSDTLTDRELLALGPMDLIHRLYHEEDVRVFRPRPVFFHCQCSRERIENVLRSLGRDELADSYDDDGKVEVTCEFCNETYRFDTVDMERLFQGESTPPHPKTRQ